MTEFREDRFVADYPVPIVDVPTERHATVSGPVGKRERPEVAAAEPDADNDFDVEAWAAGSAGKLRLGQPGGFRRCVKRLRREPGVSDPEGLCATLHHRATGKWPGEGHIVTAGAGWREELHSRDSDGKFSERAGGSGPGRTPRRSMDIEDLILKSTGRDENGDLEYESYELDEDTVAAASEMLAISHGGLSTANFKFEPSFEEHTPGTWIQGDIVDSSGANVGNFVRRVYQEDGRLKVEHTNLKLDAELQGQGFAQAFNRQLFDWYRSSGVREVRLTANIDVGGYAWARAGYDWADRMAAENIRNELSRTAAAGDERIPPDRMAEQRRLAEEMDDRFNGPRGDSYPTPYEVSQLGRWPGAGKDDWWIGKAAMMGSEWEAVIQP